jgi:hypothetical protein
MTRKAQQLTYVFRETDIRSNSNHYNNNEDKKLVQTKYIHIGTTIIQFKLNVSKYFYSL